MTIDKIKENYLAVFLSIVIVVLNYYTFFSNKIDMKTFMDKSISYSSICFGFLLAVLSLLLQSDTPAINRVKNGGRFNELINFNKKAVTASAVLVICALVYIGFGLDLKCQSIFSINILSIRLFADSISLAVFIYQITEVYLFLDLFYFIIKAKD